ncbi:porin [Paraferrimonas haliotis]|uniref:Porin n=1 Tax=Paraferrimonas haliotis TaxID=2013866 RepID=A0AA37TQY7_9GAMM|nr:porin [Paraferrimonas haliotis]GLS83873.1 porin [Paraferrimonas haliotis]GLS84000.1 porin [Paraferrimonas haliotis]
MRLGVISSAVAAALATPSVLAFEVYNDDVNSLTIGGYADIRAVNTQDTTEIIDGTSRINFDFVRQMGNGWSTQAKMEWGVNLVGNTDLSLTGDYVHTRTDEFLNNRLGFIGAHHDTYGSFTAGKQWGVYYDIAHNTDIPHVWAGTSSGVYTFNGDGGLNGTGRADKAFQYRNEFGNFKLGLQVQARNASDEIDDLQGNPPPVPLANDPNQIRSISYDNTFGISARYQVMDELELGIAYNHGKFEGAFVDGRALSETDKITGVSATWGGMYDEGLYVGFNANQAEYHEVDNAGRIMPKSTGAEAVVSYAMDNGFVPLVMMNYLKADDEAYGNLYNGESFERSFVTAGFHYLWSDKTILYIEARKDFSDVPTAQAMVEDDGIGIGMRFYM